MIIRSVTVEDSERFLDMLRQLDNETSYMMYEPGERKTTVEDMKREIGNTSDTDSLTLIAEDNDCVVGFLSAERGFAIRIRHSAYIVVGILEGHRGKGIGERLFREAEKWASENGVKRLELTVMKHNESALRLYRKMGFKIEGTREKSLVVSGKYVDEFYMSRIL